MASPERILQALLCLSSTVEDGSINVTITGSDIPVGANQTAARSRVTTNGSTADDTFGSVTFFSVLTNTVNPTVAGVDLEPGRSISFNADALRGLNAIAYTAGATSVLEINTVTK